MDPQVLLANYWLLLVLGGCLGLSAFFSGSETAFFSLRRPDLKQLKEGRNPLGHLAVGLLKDPRRLLVTILFGNMVVNVLYFCVAYDLAEQATVRLGAGGTIAGSTLALLVLLVCGEVSPKMIALRIPVTFAILGAPLLYVLELALAPARGLGRWWGRAVGRLGRRPEEPPPLLTPVELDKLVDISARRGILDRREGGFIREVLELATTTVREVMVPRVEMVLFDLRHPRQELARLFREHRLTKIPVYEHSRDNVLGLIRCRDLILERERPLRALVRPVAFVPETKTVESMLQEFRDRHSQLAIVVNEYGGVEGVLTLEDILEEIVGEIYQEDDREEQLVRSAGENRYLLDGRFPVQDWDEFFPGGELTARRETLGGFVTYLLGHIPREGERARYRNLTFEVVSIRQRRVHRVLVELAAPAEGEA